MYLVLIMFITSSIQQWRLINSIVAPRITKQESGIGTIYQTKVTCPNNGLEFAYLDNEYSSYQDGLATKPHYRYKYLVDIYYMGQLENEFGSLSQDGQDIYTKTYNYLSNMDAYGNLCGLSVTLNPITVVYKVTHQGTVARMDYTTNLSKFMMDSAIMIRNIQYQILPCHYTCKTCSGTSYNQCNSCYFSTDYGFDVLEQTNIYKPNNGVCDLVCNDLTQYFDTDAFTCNAFCPLTHFIYPTTKLCIRDDKASLSYIRQSYSNIMLWTFLMDPIYSTTSTIPLGIMCLQTDPLIFVYLQFNEGIQYNIAISSQFLQLRLDIQLRLYGTWDLDSSIRVHYDQIEVQQLKYGVDNLFYVDKGWLIKQSKQSCCTYITIRPPYYELTGQTSIKLTIQGNLQPLSAQVWQLYYVDIVFTVCSWLCQTCLNTQICDVCRSGSYLLKGKCVSVCPKYSTLIGGVCESYDDETQYSKFLFKVYHDNNEIDDEVDDYFELVSQTGLNFVKGVRFSYLSDCRIFGGPLTWFNAKFSKTYQINNPHYAIRVMMEPIIGDLEDSVSEFNYEINNQPKVKLTRATVGSTQQNIAGDSKDEYIFTINQLFTHNTNTLTVTVECIMKSSLQINEGFCAIRNYFIIILQCPTFCLACTGPNVVDCTQGSSVPNQIPNTPTCEDGYYIVDQACVECNGVEFCITYNSNNECTECKSGFTLLIGRCLCQDNYQLTADKLDCQMKPPCHSICRYCNGPTELNCSSCNDTQFRFLSQGLCKCKPTYYDSGSLICSQCIPGCISCSGATYLDCQVWLCHHTCLTCNGPSESNCTTCNVQMYRQLKHTVCPCVDGYYSDGTQQLCQQCQLQLTDQFEACYNNCGDGVVQWNEQCDDGNQYHFDGCFNCEFECQVQCSNCVNGKCLNCVSEWILNTLTGVCVELCGDGILTGNELCDDGNNDRFDGCFNCQFECIQQCNDCVEGNCLGCNFGFYLINGQCQSICGDGIVVYTMEQCDDVLENGCHNCSYICEIYCNLCTLGLCQNCYEGWHLNDFKICQTQCGDGIKAGEEECDDGIQYPDYLCIGCKKYDDTMINLQFNCIDQQFQALTYKTENYAYKSQCYNFCGDRITQWNEQCDDGNDIPFDGCYQCQYQCSLDCILCFKGVCLACSQGLVPSGSYFCSSKCANVSISALKECEEINSMKFGELIPLYQCQSSCLICSFGICMACEFGWELVEVATINETINICLKCGDGELVLPFEQCDDGNNISRDGCSNCLIDQNYFCDKNPQQRSICYKCSTNCEICQQVHSIAICIKCQFGYFLNDGQCYECSDKCISCNQTPNQCIDCQHPDLNCKKCSDYSGLYQSETAGICINNCGDGVVIQNEQCDDGNNYNGDGCDSQCQIESGFQCTYVGNEVKCIAVPEVKLSLELISQLNQKQQQVKATFNSQLIAIQFNIQTTLLCVIDGFPVEQYLVVIESNNENGTYPQNFEFTITITFTESMLSNKLNVTLIDNVFTDVFGNQIKQLTSQSSLTPIYILSPIAQQTFEYISSFNRITLYCILALLGTQLVTGGISSVLNSLDLLQQLSYLKYINILIPTMLRDYLEVFDFISLNFDIVNQTIDQLVLFGYQDAQDMFGNYGQTANFYTNILSMIIILLLTYLRYIACTIILRIFKSGFYHDWAPNLRKYIQKLLIFIVKSNNTDELPELFISGIYDISQAALISIKYGGMLTIFDKIQYYISVTTLILQFGVIMNIILKKLHPNTRQQIAAYKNNYWSQQFISLLMIKKVIFMISLVLLQSVPEIQVLLILLVSLLFGTYIGLTMPVIRKVENYQLLLTEIAIGYSMISFYTCKIQLFSIETLIYIAWSNIILVSILITFQGLSNSFIQLPKLIRQITFVCIRIKRYFQR